MGTWLKILGQWIGLLLCYYGYVSSLEQSNQKRFIDFVNTRTLHDLRRRNQLYRPQNDRANNVWKNDEYKQTQKRSFYPTQQIQRYAKSILNSILVNNEYHQPRVQHSNQYVQTSYSPSMFQKPIVNNPSKTYTSNSVSNIFTSQNKNHAAEPNHAPIESALIRTVPISNHNSQKLSTAIKNDMFKLQQLPNLQMKASPTKKSTVENNAILHKFMHQTGITDQALIARYITKRMKERSSPTTTNLMTKNPDISGFSNSSVFKQNQAFFNNNTSDLFDIGHSSILSFFEEEENLNPNPYDSDDSSQFESNIMNSMKSAEESIPIISKLITGTLETDIENANKKTLLKHLNTTENRTHEKTLKQTNTTKHSTNETPHSVSGTRTSLDTQLSEYDIMLDNINNDTTSYSSNTSYNNANLKDTNGSLTNNTTQISNITFRTQIQPSEKESTDTMHLTDIDVSDLAKTYDRKHHEEFSAYRNKTNENKIVFFKVNTKNPVGRCMDGSPPGYYLRKGIEGGEKKWVIHLHGGAWCYDHHSCTKRRNTILGSTKKKGSMESFFHGLLSKESHVNPKFFDWNVAVLSYCDGGLFSGNRETPITGKGKEFYFQGRKLLQSLLEELENKQGIKDATDVILSGTSAGGLALSLQGDFIRSYIPKKAKVRGLLDAAMFIDQNSTYRSNLARQQFKALYSLHRPVLNKDCLKMFTKKDKYLCLFPQYSIRYLKLPVFIVNSLYDHWQLSYLQGIDCIYNENRCNTEQRDEILSFRNQMFDTINDIKHYKNDTGAFANSCIAHGQGILDYTWSTVKINGKSIANSFNDWYKDEEIKDLSGKGFFKTDCKYPCNGSCPKGLAQKCVANFIGASEHRRKRSAELC